MLSREGLNARLAAIGLLYPINDAKPPPKSTGVCHTNEAYFAGLGLLAQGGERLGILDGQLGEHLAVDLDAGDLQTR